MMLGHYVRVTIRTDIDIDSQQRCQRSSRMHHPRQSTRWNVCRSRRSCLTTVQTNGGSSRREAVNHSVRVTYPESESENCSCVCSTMAKRGFTIPAKLTGTRVQSVTLNKQQLHILAHCGLSMSKTTDNVQSCQSNPVRR